MKKKSNRLEAIIEIVNMAPISCQEDLLRELKTRGFCITQATLSRSLKELGIAKVTDIEGNYRYAMHVKQASRQANFPRNLSFVGYHSVTFSNNLMVLRTNGGYANMIAKEIDKRFSDLILGTIAGDDTIFVVLRDSAQRAIILNRLDIYIPRINK